MPTPVIEKYNITDNNFRRVFRDQEELPLSSSLEGKKKTKKVPCEPLAMDVRGKDKEEPYDIAFKYGMTVEELNEVNKNATYKPGTGINIPVFS